LQQSVQTSGAPGKGERGPEVQIPDIGRLPTEGVDTVTLSRTYTVGANRATMSLSDDTGKFRVVWSPHLPGSLSPSDLAHYMSGRNALIAEMRDTLAANDCLLRPYDRVIWSEAATP
jgi:hypothetical protein